MADTINETQEIPTFPQQRTCPFHPPEGYSVLAGNGPLTKATLYNGRSAWIVTGHALGRSLLSDARMSSNLRLPGFPIISPRMESLADNHPAFIELDPPEHTFYRRLLAPEFTVPRMRAMRAGVEQTVDAHIDRLLQLNPPVDLVREFANPVTMTVICQLLGVPYEEEGVVEFLESAGERLVKSSTVEEAQAAGGDIAMYVDRLITANESKPGPGLIGRLVRDHVLADNLTREDVMMISTLLLVAGHETTSMTISLSVITLTEHPEQLATLLDDPSASVTAVDELLRYLAIADVAGMRIAKEDIPVDGDVIRAGEGVIVVGSLANRDPEVYEDPQTFNIRRSARNHLGFGYGVHQCLGQNLARLELEIAIPRLFQRIPGLRVAVPLDQLKLHGPGVTQGVDSLSVAWLGASACT